MYTPHLPRSFGFLVIYLALLGFAFANAAPALALSTSENAFRIEDSGQGNVLLGAENAVIEAGEVYGTIVLLWGNLEIHGQVNEVVILSGKVTFHPESKLNKSLAVMGGSFASLPGAQVAPENIVYRSPGPLWRIVQSVARAWSENISWMLKLISLVLLGLLFWGIGLLLFRLSPTLLGITAGRLISHWPKNLVVGLLGSLVVPVFSVLLVISILGIILLPIYFLVLFFAGLISFLGASAWVGHRLLPARRGETINPWGFLLGITAFYFLLTAGVWWAYLPAFALWTLAWGGLLRGARSLWR